MARPRRAGTFLAAAAFLGCALPAFAREDDVDFATALADRGYDDLAQQEVDRMPKGESADFTRCQLLRRAALLAAANEKTEPKEVRTRFDAAKKGFDAFLTAFPGSPHRAQAELSMSNIMKDFAYYLTTNVDRFEAKEHNAVLDEAGKTFDDAIRYLTAIRQREEDKDKDKDETKDETKYEGRNQAWFYLCLAMHDRAMLKPPGDAVRIQQLTQAIEETQKFLEETDGKIYGYLAYKLMGQDYWHRGQMQKGWSPEDISKAREFFLGTISARDMTGIEQDWGGLVDLICDTAVNFGQMCNEVGTLESPTGTVNYPSLFHEEVKKIMEKLPSVKARKDGLRMLIEDAKAMAATGFAEAAVTQLNLISNLAVQSDPSWGKAVDQMAKHGLNEVLAAIPPDSPVQLGPDVLFKAGEGSFRDRNFGRAVRAYQRVLLAIEIETDPDRKKALAANYWAKCWLKVNECYSAQERYLEAYYAADFPVQQYLSSGRTDNDMDVADLAYYRMIALNEFTRRAPKDIQGEYNEKLKAAKDLFTQKFPWSDKVGGTAYQVAVNKLGNAVNFQAQGETGKAAELFKSAIDDFSKVDAKDPNYQFSQARIGECLVQQGKPEEGQKYLEAFVKKNLAEWNSPSTAPRQRQPWGWAVFWIANALDDLKQPARVLEMLDGFEKKFKDAALDNSFPNVRFLRILALIKVGRGPEAEKETDQLVADSPDSPSTSKACLAVAIDLKARADKAHHEANQKEYLALLKRSAGYYDTWIRHTPAPSASDMTFVGQLMDDVGNHLRAAELWQKALEIFKRQGNPKMVETLTINLSGLLVNQEKYAEALPQFESLFVKTPDDIQPLRDCLESLRKRPVNVEAPIWDKKVMVTLTSIGDALAKDPDGAAQSGVAKKAAAEGNIEILLRAYADTPDMRRALARATSLTILGNDASMPAELRNAVFQLVKRSPDLLSNLARCYEELATTSPENPIRSVNLYSMLIESSPDPEDPDAPPPGSKYSERWFGWKLHWVKVFLTTGIAYKHEGSLRTVCDIIRNMETVNELKRADRERADLGKEFAGLRDKADTALRSLNKEGCK